MTSVLGAHHLFWPWVMGKLVCLIIILLPLAVYLAMNRHMGLRRARRQVVIVGAIVVIHLIRNVLFWYTLA